MYGDIGTSPLYTLRECFNAYSIAPSQANVLGILSLIFWAILIVVTLKYVWIVMRADNHGEGGTLALLALVLNAPGSSSRRTWFLVVCGMLAAALFYGDGIITPAISVLSAVEGLEVATPVFKPYVIPITIVILALLFFVQRRGTASMGAFFGPVMGIWFVTLAILGSSKIVTHPGVLAAVNPIHAVDFAMRHGFGTFVTLGAVVLAVTGAEALYADMGHFGAAPIRSAWLSFVWPALILNYFGQGALLLSDPATLKNPFFMMVPAWGLYPMLVLATVATVIASQAVITGAFSVTQQALQLGFLPRLQVIHTSAQAQGQIYLPGINWFLCIAVVGLVLGFKSSSNLAAAYGIAVTGTMLTTTLLLYFLVRRAWGWSAVNAGALIGFFFVVDFAFFSANTLKIFEGGWFPLVVAAALFTVMSTWRRGRTLLYERLYPAQLPLDEFISFLSPESPPRVQGTAVYLTARGEGTPHGLLHNLKHYKVMHERVVVLTIITENIPRVPDTQRLMLKQLDGNFYRIIAHLGFMEIPDVPWLLNDCKRLGFE